MSTDRKEPFFRAMGVVGAGGGGFVLFYVPLEHQYAVRDRLRGLLEVDFRFEQNGSQIVHYNPGSAIYKGSRQRNWAQSTGALASV